MRLWKKILNEGGTKRGELRNKNMNRRKGVKKKQKKLYA
jgi:hypothetical protein